MKLIDWLFVWRRWNADAWWEFSTVTFGMLIGQVLFWLSSGSVIPLLFISTFLLSQGALRGHGASLEREREEMAEATPTESGLDADVDGSYRVH